VREFNLGRVVGRELELRVHENILQQKYKGESEWKNLLDLSLVGGSGEWGRAPVFDVSGTHLVWKYASDSEWKDLIPLKNLTGFSPTIKVKMQTDSVYILTIENEDGEFDTPNLLMGIEKLDRVLESYDKIADRILRVV
jgi:hypothetical protein